MVIQCQIDKPCCPTTFISMRVVKSIFVSRYWLIFVCVKYEMLDFGAVKCKMHDFGAVKCDLLYTSEA